VTPGAQPSGARAIPTPGKEAAALEIGAGQTPSLVITGERTVPGIWHENYWFRRHEAVYVGIASELDDAVVLEAGCGEGYGAQLVAKRARSVVALDYDAYAIAHVGRAYPALAVVRGNLVALPFGAATYDAVVSLQTVEHLWDQDAFVAECRRVLRPGGRLILSTPNRLTFPSGNPFHARDLVDWERRHGSLVDTQLATSPDQWPVGLAKRVGAVGVGDFVLADGDVDTSLDLVAVVTFD
jgi:SAM-dependent methyltransferase